MKVAPLPQNEKARLENLYGYQLLDTLPEEDYDNLTKLSAAICNTPVSLITLVDTDRQWFKSTHGTDITETAREYAFCAHTILNPDEVMIVPDAHKDERFFDNPLVTDAPNIAFYAGVPLVTNEGYPLGSLCVLDTKPNNLSSEQSATLKILAQQAMRLIKLHKTNYELEQSRAHLEEVNKELKKFAHIVANNLQKPCNTIDEIADIVIEKYNDALDVDGQQILSLLKYSCANIKATVEDTLQQAQMAQLHQEEKTLFNFISLMEELKSSLPASLHPAVHYEPDDKNLYTFKKTLVQVLLSFVNNALLHNDKTDKQVHVSYKQTKQQYEVVITDNGIGLPVIQRGGLFEIFDFEEKYDAKDYREYLTNLNYAKQSVNKLNGKIEVSFEAGKGSRFMFSVAR